MRLFAILPTLLAIASAIGAAETTPLQQFGAEMGEHLSAAAKAVTTKPDQTAVDAAVAHAKQDGVSKLTDAELALVRGSGAHVLWRRAVAEQQRRSGDAKSAADNDGIADLDVYYLPDAERSRWTPQSAERLMQAISATSAICSLHASGDAYASLHDLDIYALDGIRNDLRPDVADAVAIEVARRPEVQRMQFMDIARHARAAGDETSARIMEEHADSIGRFHPVIETIGVVADDWQGTAALFRMTSSGEPAIALGVGIERLAIDDKPVVGAVEAVVRASLPLPITGRLYAGPAVTGRIGTTFDGDLLVGIDASIHAEYAIAYGLGATLDLGAGQRATEHAGSGIQPAASFGLLVVF